MLTRYYLALTGLDKEKAVAVKEPEEVEVEVVREKPEGGV